MVVSVLLILTLFYGCNNDSHIIYEEPAILINLTRYESGGTIQATAYGSVEGTQSVPLVSINNEILALSYSVTEDVFCKSRFTGNISIEPGEECELIVSHNHGEARATVTLPSDFGITIPSDYDTLHLDEDFILNWNTSNDAERYELWAYLEYFHRDDIDPYTAEFEDWSHFDSLVITTDTNLLIPIERLFPSGIDTVKYGSGYMEIYSENGPSIRYPIDTTERNINGNGVGYFIAYNRNCNRVHTVIENDSIRPPVSMMRPVYSPISFLNSQLQILRTYDPKFMQFEE